jgi:hypothetical protein
MRVTRHRFRLTIGVLFCAVGLVLYFAPAWPLYRLLDGVAWLFIGGALSLVPEFRLRFSWFGLGLALLFAVPGLCLSLIAVATIFGPRPHDLFYAFIGIGPFLITLGVIGGFDKKYAA